VSVSLDVVIVSYRCEALLRQCLRALEEHPAGVPTSVHVVDNASADGTAEMVAREFPDVRLTVNPVNTGFSTANNIGLRAGTADYALVLNPDTRVTPGALAAVLATMEARPEVGICGPRLELEDGGFDHAAKRSFPTPLGALAHFSGVGRREGTSERLSQYRAPTLGESVAGPVDSVNGAFMLIRRGALDQVGLFDEGYWMYMEDLDLSYRFAEAGWTSWYEPAATVVHVKSGTAGQNRSLRLNRAFHYGMYRFYRTHYAPKRNPLVNLAVYCGIAAKLAVAVVASGARRAAGRLAR
jgi:N-acetylglucosaminyl-diphospho-decaprenol L-rhamnosyltransferase